MTEGVREMKVVAEFMRKSQDIVRLRHTHVRALSRFTAALIGEVHDDLAAIPSSSLLKLFARTRLVSINLDVDGGIEGEAYPGLCENAVDLSEVTVRGGAEWCCSDHYCVEPERVCHGSSRSLVVW